jgi:HTH-type transcriptional regulator/antitoxin HigA
MARPAQVFPPGDFLREELEAREWTQSTLAKILGRPLQSINAIVNGKKEITPQTAVELGAAFGTSPELWLNLETAYRLSLVKPADPAIVRRAKEMMATA